MKSLKFTINTFCKRAREQKYVKHNFKKLFKHISLSYTDLKGL